MFNTDHSFIPESYIAQKIMIIASMSFLGINYGAGLLLAFFMLSDTILGVIKSIVLYGWVSISAKIFWVGLLTKMAILFIPISVALSGALLGYNLKALVGLCMYTLIANDAMSCYTNILSFKNKKDYKNKDLIEMLINFLRNLIYNSFNNAMKKIKDSAPCDLDDEETNKG